MVTLSLLKYCAAPGSLRLLVFQHLYLLDLSYLQGVFLHQIDEFQIEAVSLGNLQKVLLRCEASDRSQYWYCEKVIVKEPGAASESIFTCER